MIWLALAGAALAAVPADAQSINYSVTGGVGATWHSDRRACALYGLCGVQGAFTLNDSQPQGGDQALGPEGSQAVFLFDESSQSRVRQRLPDAAPLLCDDATPPAGGGSIVVEITRASGGYTAHLEGGVSSGRCEGPTEANFDAAPLRVRAEPWGLNLVGQTRFRAGPFDADLTSNLRIRREGGRAPGSVGVGPTGSGRARPPRLEFVQYSYRFVSAHGKIMVVFGGDHGPSCVAVGACGAYGRITYAVPKPDGTLVVFYSREVRKAVPGRTALRDLQHGRLGSPFFIADDHSRSRLVSSVITPGDERCTAAVTSAPGVISELSYGSPFSLTIGSQQYNGGASTGDPLRTWCPGPSILDTSNGVLATGRFPRRLEGIKRLIVRVSANRAFGALSDGYHGQLRGTLRFVFDLERAQAGTESAEKAPL
jgi:hypothetical protein